MAHEVLRHLQWNPLLSHARNERVPQTVETQAAQNPDVLALGFGQFPTLLLGLFDNPVRRHFPQTSPRRVPGHLMASGVESLLALERIICFGVTRQISRQKKMLRFCRAQCFAALIESRDRRGCRMIQFNPASTLGFSYFFY